MEVFISLFMKYLGYKPMEKLTLLDARTFILDKRHCGISASTCNFIFIQCSQCRKNCILWCTATRNFFMIHSIIRIFIWSYLAEDLILRISGKIKDKLEYHGKARNLQDHYEFKELLDILYNRSWVVYTKEAFQGADSVIRYLGRYTHRIAISNQRILGMTDQTVTYLVKDYRNGGRYIPHTIKRLDFLRMFLMHVLPKGFVRIRHYGLLSCRNKKQKMKPIVHVSIWRDV